MRGMADDNVGEFSPKTNQYYAVLRAGIAVWLAVLLATRPLNATALVRAVLCLSMFWLAYRSLRIRIAWDVERIVVENLWRTRVVPMGNALPLFQSGSRVKLSRAEGPPITVHALRRNRWLPEPVRESAIELLNDAIREALARRDTRV
jgi:hypothetical protein